MKAGGRAHATLMQRRETECKEREKKVYTRFNEKTAHWNCSASKKAKKKKMTKLNNTMLNVCLVNDDYRANHEIPV